MSTRHIVPEAPRSLATARKAIRGYPDTTMGLYDPQATANLVEYLVDDDPTFSLAYRLVQSRAAREARVVTTTGEVLFRAHRVGHPREFLWEAGPIAMAAPFTPFEDEAPLSIPPRRKAEAGIHF